jgi:hypothetical protein
MSHRWRAELPNAYDEEFPLPPGTQSWTFSMATIQPVIGLPPKAVSDLANEQRERDRATERLRRLGGMRR